MRNGDLTVNYGKTEYLGTDHSNESQISSEKIRVSILTAVLWNRNIVYSTELLMYCSK
jgi:hypothetical protein